jgi:glucosamine--fructose-6-phosphate aminotransferase (isomerizing)
MLTGFVPVKLAMRLESFAAYVTDKPAFRHILIVVPKDAIYEKVLSNIQEVRARKGRVIAIANEDDTEIEKLAEFVIRVPRTYGFFGPIINIIPLQLLAYHIAVLRGCDVDKPRNLAKSVTVE